METASFDIEKKEAVRSNIVDILIGQAKDDLNTKQGLEEERKEDSSVEDSDEDEEHSPPTSPTSEHYSDMEEQTEEELTKYAFDLLEKFFDVNPSLLQELMDTMETIDTKKTKEIMETQEVLQAPMKSYLRKCRLCSWAGRSQKELDEHKTVHVKPTVRCNVCGIKFPDVGDLRNHEKIHHKEIFQCVYCDKKFRKAIYLEKHIEVHNQALGEGRDHEDSSADMEALPKPKKKKYSCKHCIRTFIYEKSLKKHVQKSHRY